MPEIAEQELLVTGAWITTPKCLCPRRWTRSAGCWAPGSSRSPPRVTGQGIGLDLAEREDVHELRRLEQLGSNASGNSSVFLGRTLGCSYARAIEERRASKIRVIWIPGNKVEMNVTCYIAHEQIIHHRRGIGSTDRLLGPPNFTEASQ